MTSFNTNVTSDLSSRTTIGPSKIRSPTRYSDMFVDAQEEVIQNLTESKETQNERRDQTPKKASARKTFPKTSPSRLEQMKKLSREHQARHQHLPDMHYRIVETIPEALDAAVSLAEYHSISVLWEGFDVNRYGQLTWIICGYLGSSFLFNVHKCGPKIFTEGGLKTLLEARHPIKVIHDCSCLADILFHQYNVQLKSESIFDTHAADLLIQTKTSHELNAKTLTECLIEFQDIPISVYRQRESIMKKNPRIWVQDDILPELLLATARIARYAALLHGIMLRELCKPLPQLTDVYLEYRLHEMSPNPKTKIREIPPDIESLLASFCQRPIQKTEWNIPENVLNPVYEPEPGDEHFYSKPFKFDPKKATPGSLKIFSVNPENACPSDDDDWEKYVQTGPRYVHEEEDEEEYEEEEEFQTKMQELRINSKDEDKQSFKNEERSSVNSPCNADVKAVTSPVFKVPDIFSDVSSSTESAFEETCELPGDMSCDRSCKRSRDGYSSGSQSSSDNVEIIIPERDSLLPPTIAASRNPALMGTKIVWPGDPGYNDPDHRVHVMSNELSALVEKIRSEEKDNPRPKTKAFISAEEMKRDLDADRARYGYCSEPDVSSHTSSEHELSQLTQNREVVKVIQPHYDILSESGSSSADVIVEEGAHVPRRFDNSPQSNTPKSPPKTMSSDLMTCGKPIPVLVPVPLLQNHISKNLPSVAASNSPPSAHENRGTVNTIEPHFDIISVSSSSSDDIIIEGVNPSVEDRTEVNNDLIPKFSELCAPAVPISAEPPPLLSADSSPARTIPSKIPRSSEFAAPAVVSSNTIVDANSKELRGNEANTDLRQKLQPAKKKLGINFKSCPVRGRGKPTAGRSPPRLVPSMAPTEPPPHFVPSIAPQIVPPKGAGRGRGRAGAISNRVLTKDFLTPDERSLASSSVISSRTTSPRPIPSHANSPLPLSSLAQSSHTHSSPLQTPHFPNSSRPTSSHAGSLRDETSQPSSSGTRVSLDFHSDFYGANVSGTKNEPSPRKERSPQKQAAVSMCFASDSDDPDNF